MSFFGSNMAMKVFSFKQSIHFLEPDVKKGAKHTFDHESFCVLPCFFKLHTYFDREVAAGESSCSTAFFALVASGFEDLCLTPISFGRDTLS